MKEAKERIQSVKDDAKLQENGKVDQRVKIEPTFIFPHAILVN
jgi:hypothetical protein